jgi:hypothetical protein
MNEDLKIDMHVEVVEHHPASNKASPHTMTEDSGLTAAQKAAELLLRDSEVFKLHLFVLAMFS